MKHDLQFRCPWCGIEKFSAVNCTLVMRGGQVVLLALCREEKVTVSSDVSDSTLRKLLKLPILLDPDVRLHLNERALL